MAFNDNILNDLFTALYGIDFTDHPATANAEQREPGETSSECVPSYWFDRTDDCLTAYVELPGCAKEGIDVTLDKNIVYIKASRSIAGKTKMYSLKFRIGDRRDSDSISVSFKDGLLTVVAPTKKVDPAKSTRLEIH